MTSLDTEAIQFAKDGDVAVITMQFAPHNLVGKTLSEALIDNLKRAEREKARAVVIKSGLRHFSAGAEMSLFENAGARRNDVDFVGVLRAFDELPIPIISSVHGIAVGGGFEIALASDLIIAAASAKMGLVEATLGLHPLMGGVQRLIDRVGLARAKEIVLLARRHDAATLERWNVINRVVPDSELEAVTMSVAREIAAGPTVAHAATKRLASLYSNNGMRAADEAMADIADAIYRTADLQRGLDAFATTGPGSAVFEGN
ncbi:enoyl-CoA hydratase/isomerase family protein [Paraburkholderia sp. BL10I2N1]|uniref:enoyl-CoA hydratase/isomerase family protein n=1 Tax=Paraburkholderia sp. BL10I2N1 TaxID=1938796 RepID=UPI00105F602D|nr:enoyl-CoA hydratase/isomerase family protein [Paraburkholderia sp. BL10I2N1]TDN63999.1 enoyl-CoA hydratase/carnithine racemase [Paraburkholderia sp. BL10I2N1]